MNYLGVDPGAQGCVAIVGDTIATYSLKELDNADILRLLVRLKTQHRIEYALLEKITALPAAVERKINDERKAKGRDPISLSHMNAKLNQSYAAVKMALTAAEYKIAELRPVDWQKLYGMKRGKLEDRNEFKRRLRDKAQSLFPKFQVRLEHADALLLAELCRRLQTRENEILFI